MAAIEQQLIALEKYQAKRRVCFSWDYSDNLIK